MPCPELRSLKPVLYPLSAGRAFGLPSTNITVRDSRLIHRHVSIGSEMSGNVTNVTFENCILGPQNPTVNGVPSDVGVYIKSGLGRGGMVSDISYFNLTMYHSLGPLRISMGYGQSNDDSIPTIKDVTYKDIQVLSSSSAELAGQFEGLKNSIITGIQLENIFMDRNLKWKCTYAKGTSHNVTPTGSSACLS